MIDLSRAFTPAAARTALSRARARVTLAHPRGLTRPRGLARVRPLAALALAAALGLAGCGDGPSGPGVPVLTSIALSSTDVTLTAIDDTHQLTATPRDQQGQPMSGIVLTWSSSNENVATVDSQGLVTARANGTTTITAAAGGRQGSATVVVSQTSDSVAVSPPEASFGAPGVQIQFAAAAEDANGHPVAAHLFAWSSTDSSVVTVNQSGLATAQGLGEATIRATLGQAAGEAEITVEPGSGPFVVSVSPQPLVEGQAATIVGGNFHSDALGNLVQVDGAQAVVTSASTEELRIFVPTFECLPSRTVQLTVTVAEQTTPPRPTPLTAAGGALQLAVGEHLLIEDPADFCFRFDAAAGHESYLIGVQSISDAVESLIFTRITSVTSTGLEGQIADGPGGALRQAAVQSGALRQAESPGAVRQGAEPDAARLAHREMETWLRAWEREVLFSRGVPRLPAPAPRLHGLAALPQVGETTTVRVPNVPVGNLCFNYVEMEAVVRFVGNHGIWLEDPGNPDDGFTEADFESFSQQLDGAAYARNVEYLGAPTDLDGNDRILILVTKEVNRSALLGFVFAGDFFPRSDCPTSNVGEIMYTRAPDPLGEIGSAYPPHIARDQYPFLMAHELAHIIQVGRRMDAGAPQLESWILEAQATLMEEVVGHANTGRAVGQNYGYDVAFNPSGVDPVLWYRQAFIDLTRYFGFESSTARVDGAPEQCGWLRAVPNPCQGRPLWYGAGWSFLRWLSDQFGPSHPEGEAGLHRDLVDSDITGFSLLSGLTGETKARLLSWWAATLYTDGRLTGGEPRLGKSSWDLLDIAQNLPATARLEPFAAGFTDFQAAGSVRAGSTRYLRVEGAARPETAIRMHTPEGDTLPPPAQVWIVRLE